MTKQASCRKGNSGAARAAKAMIVLAVAGTLAARATASSASPAGSAPAAMSVSPTRGTPTSLTRISADGFEPGETVDAIFDTATPAGSTIADSAGNVSMTVQIPTAARPGTHLIGAIGETTSTTATSQFIVSTPWLQAGYDATHAGFNPFENVVTVDSAAGLHLVWSIDTGTSVFVNAGISTLAGSLYIVTAEPSTGSERLERRRLTDGHLRWSIALPGGARSDGITLFQGKVATQSFIAFSQATGATAWSGSAYDSSAPSFAKGSLFYPYGPRSYGNGGFVSADPSTGDPRWYAFPPPSSTGYAKGPTVGRRFAMQASKSGTLMAAKLSDHSVAWSRLVYPTSQISLSADERKGYVGVCDAGSCPILAVDVATGVDAWRSDTTACPGRGSFDPAVAYGKVFSIDGVGLLCAFDGVDGHFLWSRNLAPHSNTSTRAVVAGGLVYVTSDNGDVVAMDANTGATAWSTNVGSIPTNVTVSDGYVLVGCEDGHVYAFTV